MLGLYIKKIIFVGLRKASIFVLFFVMFVWTEKPKIWYYSGSQWNKVVECGG